MSVYLSAMNLCSDRLFIFHKTNPYLQSVFERYNLKSYQLVIGHSLDNIVYCLLNVMFSFNLLHTLKR